MEALKEILFNLPQGFIAGLMLNGTVITLAYFLVWKKFKKRLKNWRIQLKERVDSNQIKRELKNSIFTLLVGATYSSVVIYLSTQGQTKIYTNFSDHNSFFAFGGFFILLLIDLTKLYLQVLISLHPSC